MSATCIYAFRPSKQEPQIFGWLSARIPWWKMLFLWNFTTASIGLRKLVLLKWRPIFTCDDGKRQTFWKLREALKIKYFGQNMNEKQIGSILRCDLRDHWFCSDTSCKQSDDTHRMGQDLNLVPSPRYYTIYWVHVLDKWQNRKAWEEVFGIHVSQF